MEIKRIFRNASNVIMKCQIFYRNRIFKEIPAWYSESGGFQLTAGGHLSTLQKLRNWTMCANFKPKPDTVALIWSTACGSHGLVRVSLLPMFSKYFLLFFDCSSQWQARRMVTPTIFKKNPLFDVLVAWLPIVPIVWRTMVSHPKNFRSYRTAQWMTKCAKSRNDKKSS